MKGKQGILGPIVSEEYPVSDIRYPVSEKYRTHYPVSVSDIRYPVSGIRYGPIPATA